MTDFTALKKDLIAQCEQFIHAQLAHVNEAIRVAKNAAKEESKSSAGDKHETGKSHLQLSQENNSKHLLNLQQQQRVLGLLHKYESSATVKLGSLVVTNKGVYFIAIGMGAVKQGESTVFVVSPGAPVGRLLLGKGINEVITLNGQTLEIQSIY